MNAPTLNVVFSQQRKSPDRAQNRLSTRDRIRCALKIKDARKTNLLETPARPIISLFGAFPVFMNKNYMIDKFGKIDN